MGVIFAEGLIKSPYIYAKSRFVPVSFAQGLIKSPMYAKYLIIACQVAEPFALLYKDLQVKVSQVVGLVPTWFYVPTNESDILKMCQGCCLVVRRKPEPSKLWPRRGMILGPGLRT